ncbi:TonB-dependent receptor [Danxiaibacter flavus]|uniref:TonB-dependent receptor n=1 Tax=Danxiaibacter flavus TaxID=3049108 RepID=A0ABV3ZBL0_9BACT|nr:TonB-dependent receptor [Chitinophagaceae bacterium DXS]
MKKLILLLTLINTASIYSFAQTPSGKVDGKISGNEKPVEAAAISLLNAKDSSVVKIAVTDKSGLFSLEKIKNGKYLVSAEAVGFSKYYSEAFNIDAKNANYTLKDVVLKASSQQLSTVVVTASRPLIEQKIDRTVVNVDASPTNVGLSALEVLEKSPGITVDKDGNISLKGKQGVLVLVDGKPTYLSAQDLANLLKNMPSVNLDQIEIMTNPPAKYDASGNAGVINIKTKKNKVKGFNGSVTLGAGKGINPKTNNSINMNYRTGKVNIFGNYSFNWNKGMQDLDLTRKFYDSTNALESVYKQRTKMTPNYQMHSFKAGVDYFVTKKTTLGVVLNGYVNPGSFTSNGVTNIYDANNNLTATTLANNSSKEKWNNIGGNFNLRHTFDTTGTELTADLDYMNYKANLNQMFENQFYNQVGVKIQSDEILRGYLPSNINIYTAKVDFTKPLKHDAKFEAGVKTSYVKTDNNAFYDTLGASGEWQEDPRRTNHFIYTENINAAYVNYSRPLSKKWSAQLGLRLENTNSKGQQLTTNTEFERNYTQLFPTAYIGYKLNEKNQLALSYGRRIQRPDYQDMNPFYYYLDKYTYQVGNPYLKPQFSHNIELNHTFKGFLTTSLQYNKTKDIIQEVLEQIDSTHTSYVKQSNIADRDNVALSVSANFPVTKWYKTNIYAQGVYNRFRGPVNNGYIDVDGLGFMANMTNTFSLKKNWTLELNGFFRSTMTEGTLVAKPMGMVSFAVSKNVMKNKGTVRLNVRDFLDIQQFRGYSKYQNVDVQIHNQWDNRVVNISFTYRFSKGQAVQQRKRGGSDDESSRVKGGGGGN